MGWFPVLLIGLFVLEIFGKVLLVGRGRGPYSTSEAVGTLVGNALLIWGIATYF